MNNQIQIFNVISVNEELEEEFRNFFPRNDLMALFTDEHKTSSIKVTDNDLRAVINSSGKYNKLLKQFHDYLVIAQDNKSYQEGIFKLIHDTKSFQGLINNIKKVMRFIDSEIESNHLYNTWNIVFYNKELL